MSVGGSTHRWWRRVWDVSAPHWTRSGVVIGAFALAFTVLALAVTVLIALFGSGSGSASNAKAANSDNATLISSTRPDPPEAAFTSPKGALPRVPMCYEASGTSRNIPDGSVLWMVVQIPDADNQPYRYYPSHRPVTMTAQNAWKQTIRVGDKPDVGRPYRVRVYLLAKSQVEAVEESTDDALVRLPPGFSIQLATEEVVRTAEQGSC